MLFLQEIFLYSNGIYKENLIAKHAHKVKNNNRSLNSQRIDTVKNLLRKLVKVSLVKISSEAQRKSILLSTSISTKLSQNFDA